MKFKLKYEGLDTGCYLSRNYVPPFLCLRECNCTQLLQRTKRIPIRQQHAVKVKPRCSTKTKQEEFPMNTPPSISINHLSSSFLVSRNLSSLNKTATSKELCAVIDSLLDSHNGQYNTSYFLKINITPCGKHN